MLKCNKADENFISTFNLGDGLDWVNREGHLRRGHVELNVWKGEFCHVNIFQSEGILKHKGFSVRVWHVTESERPVWLAPTEMER